MKNTNLTKFSARRTVPRMESLQKILIWEPLVSLAALIGGWVWAIWERLTRCKESKLAEVRYQNLMAANHELMDKMDLMIGKTVEEQRQIMTTVKETYMTFLTRPDGTTEKRTNKSTE